MRSKGKPSTEAQRAALAGIFTTQVAPSLVGMSNEALQRLCGNPPYMARRLRAYVEAGCPDFPHSSMTARPSGLILPERKLVEATAIDFSPDMFPDCRVGAAVQMGIDFGVPIEEALARRGDPTRVGAVRSDLFTEANFPTSHPGVVWANLFAVNYGRYMSNAGLQDWPAKIKIATGRDLRYASAKVEAQALQAAPRPAFDGCYPLVAYGNHWADADGDRYFLRASLGGGSRDVAYVWSNPRGGWDGHWWFLVLEYLEALVL